MQTAREQESILICTQCGHINPATNKFCGNCGNGLVSIFDAPPSKTVDNRKVVDSGTVTMPDLTNPPPAAKPQPPSPHAQVVPRETPRPVAAESRPEPRQVFREELVSPISGPSFLGLSSDPTATADYLLEEEPRKGGPFRFLMILAILALIVVGALEWRAIRKMVAEQSARLQSSPATEQAPPAASSDATPPAATDAQPSATTPATANPATTPGSDLQQHPLVEMDLPAAGQAQSQSQPQQAAQPGAVPPASQPAPTQQNVQTPAPTNPPAAGTSSQPQAASQSPTAAVKPNNGARIQRASDTPGKALTASLPAKSVQEPPKEKLDPAKDPSVVAAEKYLYGPSRNCTAARKLLEQAAGQQNPSAMSHLGGMYATGQCVSADKTLAYIWFSRAYEVNPENQWLEKNLTMLWRDMSSSERQVVLKAKGSK
jgi:TPR repeat protein